MGGFLNDILHLYGSFFSTDYFLDYLFAVMLGFFLLWIVKGVMYIVRFN